jgi:uncharacterized protein (UPF0332 family)
MASGSNASFFMDRAQIAKTHSGLRSEFFRLARETPELDNALPVFLAKAYRFKDVADYGAGPDAVVTSAEADDAITRAAHFVAAITALLAEPPRSDMV